MLTKLLNQAQFKQVTDDGAKKARMAVLIGPEEGAPNFVMRRIELEAGGCTPYHQHAWGTRGLHTGRFWQAGRC
ncbi:MAG: hypothetical protein NTW14_01030 [bacterium]|nr:hypothetical protein [bacterium]